MLLSATSLSHLLASYGYAALFAVVFLGGTLVPLPGGLAVLAAGAYARIGEFSLPYSFLAALSASVISDLIPFFIARRFGKNRFFARYVRRRGMVQSIHRYLNKHPAAIVFFSRFAGFANMPVNVLSGLSRIHKATFFLSDIAANLLSTAIYLSIGYVVGIAVVHSKHLPSVIGWTLAVIVIFYTATVALGQYVKKKRG